MHDHDEPIPPRLADDLAEAVDARVFVPPARDEAILSAARARLTPARPASAGRPRIAHARLAAAILFAVGVTLLVVVPLLRNPLPARELDAPTAARNADLDASGSIDIVDAYLLARHVQRRDTLDPALDQNHDGRIDEADVDALAHRAVALTGGAG